MPKILDAARAAIAAKHPDWPQHRIWATAVASMQRAGNLRAGSLNATKQGSRRGANLAAASGKSVELAGIQLYGEAAKQKRRDEILAKLKRRGRNALLGGAFGAALGSVIAKESWRGGRAGLLIGGTAGALVNPRKRAELAARVRRTVQLNRPEMTTMPLRGATLRHAGRMMNSSSPMLRETAVMKPLVLRASKSLEDIAAQRSRISAQLGRAIIQRGKDIYSPTTLKRAAILRAVTDYLGPKNLDAGCSGGKRVIKLRDPRAKDEAPASWFQRNKYRIAGVAAAIAGVGALAAHKDRGMKMKFDPESTFGDEVLGNRTPAMRADAIARAKAPSAPSAPPAAPSTPPSRAVAAQFVQPGTRTVEMPKKTLRTPEAIAAAAAARKADRPRMEAIANRLFRWYSKSGNPKKLNSMLNRSMQDLPTITAVRGAARASKAAALRKTFRFEAKSRRIVQFNLQDEDQQNRFTPSLAAGTIYRKGRRAVVWVKRSGNISQDAADTLAGRARKPGQKREWEKSWFKNAVAGAGLGLALWGAPRAYAYRVTQKSGGLERPGTTIPAMISHIRKYGMSKLLSASARRRAIELADTSGSGVSRGRMLKRVAGAALIGAGVATLPPALPLLRIQARRLIGKTEGQSARFVADYLRAAERAGKNPITSVAGDLAGLKVSQASRGRNIIGRKLAPEAASSAHFTGSHSRKFLIGGETAHGMWDWEVSGQLHSRAKPIKRSLVSQPGEKGFVLIGRKQAPLKQGRTPEDIFHAGRVKAHAAIQQNISQYGDDYHAAIDRLAGSKDREINSYFRTLATEKAGPAKSYARKALVAPGLIAAGTAAEITRRRREQRDLAARVKRAIVLLDDTADLRGWDLRDARGRSARVFAPGSQRRDRREKSKWEKIDTIRAVRNAALGAAVLGLGGTAALALRNRQLVRALRPKPEPKWADIIQHNFRASS